MKTLRVVDDFGNKQDYETPFVPRIGERILLRFGNGQDPITDHYYRVKDVMYHLDPELENQAAILIEEEKSPELWPG